MSAQDPHERDPEVRGDQDWEPAQTPPLATGGGSVREVALLFLKLGTIAFGGPAAHTAMMRDELVRRRGWVSDQRFVDLMGATNLIPGPNSTELAIHLGFDRARWRGLVTAGVCFILPAALMVTALAWAYVTYGDPPAVQGLLYGIVPAVIAIIAHALFGLLGVVIKNVWLAVLTLGALATGVSVAPAAAEGVRTGRAGDSGTARMAGECTDPGFVGAIRFRNPLGLYEVDCIRPESVRYPGPVFVTHCKPTNGGWLNLHMPGGEVLECPATVYRDAIGYSAWA